MNILPGKYTVERFAQEHKLGRQSAINALSRLKKQGFVEVSGGGSQKRIYAVSALPRKQQNGFYALVNKFSPEKLQPRFEHYVHGKYTVEQAIIDGLRIGDARTKQATMHLFNHVTNWKRLMDAARKNGMAHDVIVLYQQARKTMKCRRMPQRYLV
ncbi:MAG: hypothetical protein V1725_03460 [archaeon]